ncbi:hypothetical protein [Psychroserpens sp. NJDZ02]|uniref:hypothetical protein n=1 Tax=Psychroserpens sp. NJDZ02 TaxID=2570561 RepID=UPI0010A91021|nr:hypothetical protein [Psychroserpens sp. NJDZ02]QCE40972.1 hypothetical protein E9099_05920 [Psychroserpens sp. NJDZ02]
MTKKTETYSRQLKYLLVLGDEIIKEDGIFREGLFFSKLREFTNFYKEIKSPVSEIIEEKKKHILSNYPIVLQTDLKFVNYQYPALPIFILMLVFPMFALGYFILKYRYVKKTKSKLRVLLQNLSSINLIVENNTFKKN